MDSVQRRCYGCGLVKAIEDFPIKRREKHGSAYQCKVCHREENRLRRKEYRAKYPERHREQKNRYVERHREAIREQERCALAKRRAERKAAGLCTKCGKKSPLDGMSYCAECGEKNRRGRQVDRPYGAPRVLHPKLRRVGPRQKRKEPKVRRDTGCALCGFELIDLHHIDEDFRNTDPANIIALCPNHHRMVHRHLLCIIPRRQ